MLRNEAFIRYSLGGDIVPREKQRTVTVIKGPLFEKVLQNAFVYTNKMIQRKLDEGGLEKFSGDKENQTTA